jgi:peptide deformylase
VLYKIAKTVDFKWPYQNESLADKLFTLMAQENGIGLAAPQVGISKRLFVMSVHGRQRACFNPAIKKTSDVLTDFDEGCLSFPGEQCTIKRPDWVEVNYQEYDGTEVIDTLVGLEARCFQHELDHLNGITMHDRLKEQHAEQP